MSKTKEEIIAYRLGKAQESLDAATLLLGNQFHNVAVGELYYACFYRIGVLFAATDIHTATHRGVRKLFALNFIKTGKIDAHWNVLVAKLFDMRQRSDYDDFVSIDEGDVQMLLDEVKQFRSIILQQLQTF